MLNEKKQELLEKIKSWILIFVGCTAMCAGFVFFINPYNIIPGGVYGASIVLHNIFPSVQVGTFGYCFEIPLMLLSLLLLGAKLGIRTIVACLVQPLIMNVLSWMAYPDQASLEALDPTRIAGGLIDMSDHLMLATFIGSTLIGIGCGIVVRNQATTGGTDIVAMILQKYAHLKFSTGIFIVDSFVVMFGVIVIGFGVGSDSAVVSENPSLLLMFYSLIAIFVASRVVAFTITGSKNDKLLFIISDEKLTSLHKYILDDLDRSGTCIKSSGLYSKGDKEMLMLVVNYKEANIVKSKIKEADPRAFVIVTDAYDTYGEGWKPLPVAEELQPE